MHDVAQPHCSSCEHFQACFYTDMVVEWGYCALKVNGDVRSAEIEDLKTEVEAGNQRDLLERAARLNLFVPTFTNCKDLIDIFPF